jgi:hypothetical protein
MGSNRGTKLASKNMGSINNPPDFSSTINITTNSKIKEKLATRKASMAKATEKIDLTNNNLATAEIKNVNISNNISAYNNFALASSNLGKKSEEKAEKKEKIESSFNLRDLRTLHKEKMKENYNSNNSNRSLKNIMKEEKVKPKHQKHASEIPQGYKVSNPNLTDNYLYHQTTSNNILEIYTHTTNNFNKDRELFEKTNLDPKVVKVKSSNILNFDMPGNNRSSRGFSNHAQKESNSVNSRIKDLTSTMDYLNAEDSNNNYPITHSASNLQMLGKPKEDFEAKYKALLGKYRDSDRNVKELMRTIDILKNFIKASETVSDNAKYEIVDKISKKNTEIKNLKVKYLDLFY